VIAEAGFDGAAFLAAEGGIGKLTDRILDHVHGQFAGEKRHQADTGSFGRSHERFKI
jgi:hypothetical protein